VVVIGSGATAVTLIPALAATAAHVTMLQRSPSYILSLPEVDELAGLVRRVLPERHAHRLLRWKNMWMTLAIYGLSRRRPALMRRILRGLTRRRLPAGFDVDTHFNPRYDPWDQRLCIVPDSDLFRAIGAGRVSVVTDTVETFTETGIRLRSGAELEADLVVTATGLQLLALGGMELTVDARAVELAKTVAYRGMQLAGVPNLAFAFGYTNQSWTLGCDLTCEQVCRLLQHMDRHGHVACTPRDPGPGLVGTPFVDLSSGYVLRAIERFPRQGADSPWRREQHYARNRRELRRARLDDPVLEFTRARAPAQVAA
jgi:cation diffusion facilitator CzcD-associated flavoprotein CzcO